MSYDSLAQSVVALQNTNESLVEAVQENQSKMYGLLAGAEDLLGAAGSQIQYQHKKSLICQLPIVFPDYVAIQSAGGNAYLYPQGFYFDERANQILIAYNSFGGTYTRTIAVYDATSFTYISCFILQLPEASGGGESFTVVYDDGGQRFLVNKLDSTNVAKYPITSLPANRAVLNHTSVFPVPGIFFQLSSCKGEYLIEDTGPSIGGPTSRTQFGVYDSDFNRIRAFSYTKFDCGFTGSADNALAPLIPKTQGVALGNGYIATVHGGIIVFNDPTTFKRYASQGPRLYSTDGRKIAESICDPFKMKQIFEDNGLPTDRFEYEGVCVTESNRIMSLNIHQSRFGAQALLTGIVIMQEFSSQPGAIDFTPAVQTFPHPSKADLETGMFPRGSNGKLYHPVTGAPFDTLEQVVDYMDLMQVGQLRYYHASVGIIPITGMVLDSTSEVTITNNNHITFLATVNSVSGSKVYRITGSSGSRTALLLNTTTNGIRFSTETEGVVDRLHRIRGESRDNTLRDTLFLDLQEFSTNTDLRIGGGSTVFDSCTRIRLYTSPTVGGVSTEKWQVAALGDFSPAVDNTYSIGRADSRVSQIFAGTAAINLSDMRYKKDIEAIPDVVLDAWEKIEYQQYRFIDPAKENGRLHTGLLAQSIEAVFVAAGVDPFAYGILCYDEWEAAPAEYLIEPAVLDDSGNVTQPAVEQLISPARQAGSRYGVRYEEALVLEAALMRRVTAKLHKRLEALEAKV